MDWSSSGSTRAASTRGGRSCSAAASPGSTRRERRASGRCRPAPPTSRCASAASSSADGAAADSPWAEHYGARIEALAAEASDAGRLDARAAAAIVTVIERISELAGPDEPPARVHGDLWSGNVLAAADGRPWLIDPAAHGAHREIDLAMLRLFGSVPARTLAAYEEVRPLAPGHEERVSLWQIQPLLVHAILFGGGYGAAAARAAALYG